VQPEGTGGVTRPPPVRGETAPAEKETAVVQRCPRCATRIEGDYRFCPSCAFRLRAGTEPEPEAAPTAAWRKGFLVAAGTSAFLGVLLVGAIVLYPSWLPGAQATAPDATPESASYAEPAFTVADIRNQIVELPAWGYVTTYEIGTLAPTEPDDVTRLKEFRDANPEVETLPVYIPYELPIMKYEVTQGQYEEFLRDVAEHPERAPEVWVRMQKGATKPQDVRLWPHVPEPWITRDRDGEPVSWRVDPLQRNLPVTYVSYYDAWAFAAWAGQRLGLDFVLPNEMEWTRAARAGRPTAPWPADPRVESKEWAWPWGAEPLVYACNNAQFWPGQGRTEYVHFVYSEPRGGDGGATPDGLFGMAGNASEWALLTGVHLVSNPDSSDHPYIRPVPIKGTPAEAAAMGGSFREGIDDCQVKSRREYKKVEKSSEAGDTYTRRDDVGFRLVVRKPE
jgi:formylglycine-generating enzyme required for sulfatase activity